MKTHYNKMGVTPKAIADAEKVLADNGIEADEVQTVLQAIGYALLDCELYPVPIYQNENVDITDWINILTAEDIDECKAFTAKIHFGFNRKSLTKQIERFEKGDIKERCKVWFILDDCNFPCASLLAEGKVKETYEWIKQNLV